MFRSRGGWVRAGVGSEKGVLGTGPSQGPLSSGGFGALAEGSRYNSAGVPFSVPRDW